MFMKVLEQYSVVVSAMPATSLQSCSTFYDSMDYSLSVSSVHGIYWARILEWIAMPSRGSSRPRNQTFISYVSYRQILYH